MIMLTLNWAVMGIVFFAACQEVSPADSGNVNGQLQEISDLNFLGHGASYAGLVSALSTDFLGSIPTILDEPALARNGSNLDNMALPPSPFHAGRVSRRSSLRFVLDVGGLGYFVDENKKLVVTTKPLARVKWMTTLPNPTIEDLKAGSLEKRREAAFAAGFYHLDPDVWVLPLVRALDDADRDIQFDSVFALGELGSQANDGIDALIALLKSKDLTLREVATYALGRIGAKALVRLGELIYDPDPAIALAAINAFAVMGNAGNEAVPELITAGKYFADRKVNWDDTTAGDGGTGIGICLHPPAQLLVGASGPRLRDALWSAVVSFAPGVSNQLRVRSCGCRCVSTIDFPPHLCAGFLMTQPDKVILSTRYTIEGVLGKGGMGEVLLATDIRLGRKVVIKRIPGDAAKSQTAVRRFITEAKSIASLNHPNIVQIHDYGRDKDSLFLILEYVEGNSLLDRCQQGAMPLEEAITLTCHLCDGLSRAHELGIVHRDLKPANVLLTKDGTPKLTDFDLARVENSDTGETVSGAISGTLDFMPSEQRLDATQADARSDLWSLAATLYQMVTGETPKTIRLNDVPVALQKVLGKALEDSKADRYQTAREFKEALRASLQDTSPDIIDLGEGQCVHCGTKNDSVRKFCHECAVSLRVACLSCGEVIPVWDKVCGVCGTKQAELLEERRKAMAAQQSQAESLLKNYEFDQATTLAVALRDESDPRLQQFHDWSKHFPDLVETGRKQQQEWISSLLSEALQHEKAYDYPSGIHALEQVREILRGTLLPGVSLTPETLLKRLREKQDEVHRLDELIRQRVKSRRLNGLLQEVNSLLKLCPDRSDLQRVKAQLIDRDAKLIKTRDEAFAAAQQLLQRQDYAGAIKELDRIDASVVQAEMKTLRATAESLQSRLHAQQNRIAAALEQKQLSGLLKTVEECLSLKTGDAELEALRDRLIKREEKRAAQFICIMENAEQQRRMCQFAAASLALQRIPEELRTEETLGLMAACDAMAPQRKSLMKALQDSMTNKSYAEALKISAVYLNKIHAADLTDSEFETQYQACQQALYKETQDAATAARQRRVLIGLSIGSAVLVLLSGFGFIIRSSIRASAEKQRQPEIAAAAAEKQRQPEMATAAAAAPAPAAAVQKERETVLALPAIRNSVGMAFKVLPGGTFTMGDGSEAHPVTLTQQFEMGIYEVTQEQYERVMGTNPSRFKGKQNPVEEVSWDDAEVFCRKLSELPAEKAAGYVYRLPTEAEWEYACRAGTTTKFSFGDSYSELGDFAWYSETANNTAHAVGQKKPNAWGLYDMHGNVWEWCADWSGAYPGGSVTDPRGPASGSNRVLRGGSWRDSSGNCRSAYRRDSKLGHRNLYLGFRVLRSSVR
jgi:formylglycine-generating enzyme required for sulfatase activity/serine/threonine protein kinase